MEGSVLIKPAKFGSVPEAAEAAWLSVEAAVVTRIVWVTGCCFSKLCGCFGCKKRIKYYILEERILVSKL